MVIDGDIITLKKREVDEILELECQKRLHMTLKDLLQRRKQGTLPKSTAVHEIEMLMKLAYK